VYILLRSAATFFMSLSSTNGSAARIGCLGAGLHPGLRVDSLDCLRELGQAVHSAHQHVLDAAGVQVVRTCSQNLEPSVF
jgi:hypothetical protein